MNLDQDPLLFAIYTNVGYPYCKNTSRQEVEQTTKVVTCRLKVLSFDLEYVFDLIVAHDPYRAHKYL